jgi:hypothetical protein
MYENLEPKLEGEIAATGREVERIERIIDNDIPEFGAARDEIKQRHYNAVTDLAILECRIDRMQRQGRVTIEA